MAPHPETRRRNPIILWGAVLAVAVLAVIGIRQFTREDVEVHTAKVSYQDLVKVSSTNGKVEPIEDFQAHAQTPGVVEQIYVSVGDKVRPGELLIRMDDADAKARLASALSALQAAKLANGDIAHGGSQDERNTFAGDLSRAKLQRQQDATSVATLELLQAKGAASAAEVSAARQRLQVDDSNLTSIEQHSTQRYGDAERARAQAQLADAQAAVSAAQSAVANTNIRSPLAGSVYSIPIAQYDFVPAGEGSDLVYVADLNRIQVTAYFDEPEIGNLAVGQPVKIVWDARPDKTWHGHITAAPSTIITYGTRNVGEAFITVDDAKGDLLPNTNVTVTVTTLVHRHVLSLPREALHTEQGEKFVFRVMRNKLVKTPIQVGSGTNLTRVEIAGGLAEGDTVALSATTNRDLTNGLVVKSID